MKTSSTNFYKTLYQTFSEIEDELRRAGVEDSIGFVIWAGRRYRPNADIEIEMSFGGITDKVEVKGRDIWAMADEILRRFNFNQAQKNLQIGPPMINDNIELE